MSLIKDFLRNRNTQKIKENEYEQDDRVRRRVEARHLSHDERVLLESLEKEKQKTIKQANYWDERLRRAKEKLGARRMMQSNIFRKNEDFLKGGFDDWD